MNPETKIIKFEIDLNLVSWRNRARLMYRHSRGSAKSNLIDALKDAWKEFCTEGKSYTSRAIMRLSMGRVDYKELADYLLEDIDSVAIEDWPEYTWGVVVKGSNTDYIKIGHRISICDGEVLVDSHLCFKWACRWTVTQCQGTRVKELNNE